VLRGTTTVSGHSQPIALTGQVVYDDEEKGRGTVTTSDPESGEPVKVELVQDGTQVYMRSSQFDKLPEGREWMGIDIALGDELDTSPPASVDAKGELGVLEEVTGNVQRVGKEDVRGVPTTRYRTSISVSESAERLREEGGEDTALLVEKEGTPMQVEVWIDAEELVRRMRLVQSQPGEEGDGPTTTDMRMDFLDFGLEPEIEVPDSDEVFDTTSMVEEDLGTS
jgi:hypothetical protein